MQSPWSVLTLVALMDCSSAGNTREGYHSPALIKIPTVFCLQGVNLVGAVSPLRITTNVITAYHRSPFKRNITGGDIEGGAHG